MTKAGNDSARSRFGRLPAEREHRRCRADVHMIAVVDRLMIIVFAHTVPFANFQSNPTQGPLPIAKRIQIELDDGEMTHHSILYNLDSPGPSGPITHRRNRKLVDLCRHARQNSGNGKHVPIHTQAAPEPPEVSIHILIKRGNDHGRSYLRTNLTNH